MKETKTLKKDTNATQLVPNADITDNMKTLRKPHSRSNRPLCG